jgi:hypothetical protein
MSDSCQDLCSEEGIQALIDFDFLPDETKDKDQYRAPANPQLERHLKKHVIEYHRKTVPAPEKSDPDKRAQLEAVKRWFHDDWRRIEPKLRASSLASLDFTTTYKIRVDCQTTRKSYKTSHSVGWVVGWKKAVFRNKRLVSPFSRQLL